MCCANLQALTTPLASRRIMGASGSHDPAHPKKLLNRSCNGPATNLWERLHCLKSCYCPCGAASAASRPKYDVGHTSEGPPALPRLPRKRPPTWRPPAPPQGRNRSVPGTPPSHTAGLTRTWSRPRLRRARRRNAHAVQPLWRGRAHIIAGPRHGHRRCPARWTPRKRPSS